MCISLEHHRYVRPGVKGRLDEARRGEDFFEGEEELMAAAMSVSQSEYEERKCQSDSEQKGAESVSTALDAPSGPANPDIFDNDNFMKGLRSEKLFGDTDLDDVNLMENLTTMIPSLMPTTETSWLIMS
ncbi:uncharacterized protein PITG_04731 [Phytophthora infestans T30-4]|uniref:Uncharacterized protein n=1 Tax=Phytophthora infestans (strain T30-4) TaxID=403677 RepID=D0N1X2_PHYIT|nr:uncharacterized protein PITG_04731 [Phytophthora infestans T30-4]EEY68301.1 hypothetical protein PITG_04731 [Phytophthora infestans T30-4]|eukprot:XP_002905460.1 hypothetical protein PITG_04731 [Phytophthora infestans T30-4]